MALFRFFPLLALLVTGAAFGCPEGMMVNPARTSSPNAVGQPECIPNTQGGGWDTSSPPPRIKVYNGYGAFAFDEKQFKVGVSDPQDLFATEGKAKRSAIKSCKQNGGSDCQVIATFVNQCAVTMLGASDSSGSKAALYVGKGATILEAKSEAEGRCKASGSPICKPGYADCVEEWHNG